MNESHPTRRTLRSIGAVLAGFIAVVALSLGTDEALRAAGIFPGPQQTMTSDLFLIATAYRAIYNIGGCYIMAWFAPDHPMLHALVGGAIGFVLSMVGAVLTWNAVPPLGPHWYPVALVVLAMPCAWVGGKLRLMQKREQAA